MQQESINIVFHIYAHGINIGLHTYAYDNIDIVWKGRDYIFQSEANFMTVVDLSCNSLSGGIPLDLTELKGLRMMLSLVVSQNTLAICHF